MTPIDWIKGDYLGLEFPTHAQALEDGGSNFLTRAFRACGALAADNSVSRISECREIAGGSTGRKLLLSVEYQHPNEQLHNLLFVKFSRAFDDPVRDATKVQMEREIPFALLSRAPQFPITIPRCYFADFHQETGCGILITQRILFDSDAIEPHYPKCQDHLMPDQLAHYRALLTQLARLAGTHRSGQFPDEVARQFPYEPEKLTVSSRPPYSPEEIRERINRYRDFCAEFPQLLPAHLRAELFIQRLLKEGPEFQALKTGALQVLKSDAEMVALCHWNAHVDNAWFWRDKQDQLQCGLMDWGNASQMNVVLALWGCLSGAELFIWDEHLDELLHLFKDEFQRCGGPHLDLQLLKQHLTIYVAMMGLEWMLDAPAAILKNVPDLASARDRFDPIVQQSERARSQLLIMSLFLNLWEKSDMAALMKFMSSSSR